IECVMPKIVFITGATSGFGKACAEKFAAGGYDLILNGRREDRLQELCNQLEARYNVAGYLLPFDVRDEKAVFQSVNNLPDNWKNIDVLINNAGLALGRDYFEEADLEDWNTMVDTNIKGFMYVAKDRKSTRLNSSHVKISYAVFCLKTKKINNNLS